MSQPAVHSKLVQKEATAFAKVEIKPLPAQSFSKQSPQQDSTCNMIKHRKLCLNCLSFIGEALHEPQEGVNCCFKAATWLSLDICVLNASTCSKFHSPDHRKLFIIPSSSSRSRRCSTRNWSNKLSHIISHCDWRHQRSQWRSFLVLGPDRFQFSGKIDTVESVLGR